MHCIGPGPLTPNQLQHCFQLTSHHLALLSKKEKEAISLLSDSFIFTAPLFMCISRTARTGQEITYCRNQTFNVWSTQGQEYEVNGNWTCTCGDFVYRSSKNRSHYGYYCKHIAKSIDTVLDKTGKWLKIKIYYISVSRIMRWMCLKTTVLFNSGWCSRI